MAFSTSYTSALATAAARLGIPDPAWLKNLIQAESGWNAKAYNAGSGATGLIQWIPRVMRDFGFLPLGVSSKIPASGALSTALKKEVSAAFLLRYPDTEKQLLGPVVDYLKRYKPFPTEKSLYLAVFYPAYRDKSLETPFPDSVKAANPGIDTLVDAGPVEKLRFPDSVKAANPGIDTVGAYVKYVQSKARGSLAPPLGIFALASIAAATYIASR